MPEPACSLDLAVHPHFKHGSVTHMNIHMKRDKDCEETFRGSAVLSTKLACAKA